MRKRSEKPKEEKNIQNRILNKLEAVENRIDVIETSLRNLSESKQRGWLIFGVVLGGLLGISVNLWTSYFMIVFEPKLSPSDWMLTLTLTTIALGVGIFYMTYWAYKKIND